MSSVGHDGRLGLQAVARADLVDADVDGGHGRRSRSGRLPPPAGRRAAPGRPRATTRLSPRRRCGVITACSIFMASITTTVGGPRPMRPPRRARRSPGRAWVPARAAWPSACAAAWRTASSTVGASAMANSSDWPSTSTCTARASVDGHAVGCRRRIAELDAALLLAVAQPHGGRRSGAPATAPDVAGQQPARSGGGRRSGPVLVVGDSGDAGNGQLVRWCRSASRRRAWPAARSASAGSARLVRTPEDQGLGERALQGSQRRRSDPAVDDQLGEQRVVSVRHLVALADAGVDAGRRPASAGRARDRWPAGSRRRGPPRTGGPRSRGRANRTSAWSTPERLAGGDPQLVGHQVAAGDRLGHRMLDLQPGVHLQEVEVARIGRAGTRPCPALT